MIIQQQIQQKLSDEFKPLLLDVINESQNHNVPAGSESHFKVIVVSNAFDGKRLLQRHRAVNKCLAVELSDHIHALAIHTFTEAEWQETQSVSKSPNCLGGSKGDEVMAGKLGK
ncbi:MAG: BolA/IbaG family iron-sulfur metabolism protein [Gammaproteobacteria bacterium]|nr:BolA/IbaG family iron-sulfur metabolism protein [Gammaproteobacteria bacterium]